MAAEAAHPRHQLDATIHSPVRLSIVSALSSVERADFKSVRDALQVSDSALSKHVAVLEEAGYLDVTKGRVARRPRTWLALTQAGQLALRAHLAALNAITTSALPSVE